MNKLDSSSQISVSGTQYTHSLKDESSAYAMQGTPFPPCTKVTWRIDRLGSSLQKVDSCLSYLLKMTIIPHCIKSQLMASKHFEGASLLFPRLERAL